MKRYALLIIPPKDTCDYIDSFRKKYNRNTKDKIPPHITIYPLFFLKKGCSEEMIINKISSYIKTISADTIYFKSLRYFKNKNNNIVYIKPDKSSIIFLKNLFIKSSDAVKSIKPHYSHKPFTEKLFIIISNFVINLANQIFQEDFYTPEIYSPHITLAENISRKHFDEIIKKLKKYNINISFKVTSVCIYTNPGGGIWNKLTEVKLNNQ